MPKTTRLADLECAGRCRRRTLHHLLEATPERWVARCVACNTAFRLWLTHAAQGPRTRCGLPLEAPLRVAGPGGASCPECQRAGFVELGVPLEPVYLACLLGREGNWKHTREAWLDHRGGQVVRHTCTQCQGSAFWGGALHRLDPAGAPACGGAEERPSDLLRRPWVAPLAGCVRCLAVERARSLIPDWRPLGAIPEDFYAV